MSAERIEKAKLHADWSKARLDSTMAALQQRLHPGTLASDAWDGVREKGNNMADNALDAVRQRPAAVSAAVGAFALFLARQPLKRAVSRMLSGGQDDGLVTTRIDNQETNYDAAAPIVDAPLSQGVR